MRALFANNKILSAVSTEFEHKEYKIESDPVLIHKFFENHHSDPVLIRQGKRMYFCFAS